MVKKFITFSDICRNIGYIIDKEISYNILISLKSALSPLSEMYKGRIIQKYKAL